MHTPAQSANGRPIDLGALTKLDALRELRFITRDVIEQLVATERLLGWTMDELLTQTRSLEAPPSGCDAAKDRAFQSTDEQAKFVTLCDLTEELRVSRTTIWKLRRSAEFPSPIRVSRQRLVWRRSDIDEWVASRQSE